MSQENIEITRQSLDAFNRGDKRSWLTMFDPGAEMIPAPEWPENAPIRGAEAIWDFYVEVTGAWEEGLSELGEVIDAGAGRIVANNRRDARGRTSGAGAEFSYWTVSTFRNGQVVRMEWFTDRAKALEAVGLSGSSR
jgi:ketosteroid isomerase-like protein